VKKKNVLTGPGSHKTRLLDIFYKKEHVRFHCLIMHGCFWLLMQRVHTMCDNVFELT